MTRTRIPGIAGACVFLLAIVQEAIETIQAYHVAESNNDDFRYRVWLYLSWLCLLLALATVRIAIVAASKRLNYVFVAGSWLFLAGLAVTFLFIFAYRPVDERTCRSDGVCFYLYDLSRTVILYPTAAVYVLAGSVRSIVTIAISALRCNRKYK